MHWSTPACRWLRANVPVASCRLDLAQRVEVIPRGFFATLGGIYFQTANFACEIISCLIRVRLNGQRAGFVSWFFPVAPREPGNAPLLIPSRAFCGRLRPNFSPIIVPMSAKMDSIVADAGFFRGLSGASRRASFSRSHSIPS